MIVSKCPLRISLAGGSTDLQDFVDKHGHGAVISFPATAYVYITVHSNNRNQYIINYTQREETTKIGDIKNDIAREVLKKFNCKPVTVTFNADIHSVGSGLAASSAYLIAAIGAIAKFKNVCLSQFEICNLALEMERSFNPLTGYQDPYGCGMGSLKKMTFYKGKEPQIEYFKQSIFNGFNMFLLYSNVKRKSTKVLKEVASTDRRPLLQLVGTLERAILTNNTEEFLNCINAGWKEKKKSSPHILSNSKVRTIDNRLCLDSRVLAHRLCGAGNGGYFFILTQQNTLIKDAIRVTIEQNGLQVYAL
jgi:D-glycero-alpha-D-manno-heptose-7-phosphate kinase